MARTEAQLKKNAESQSLRRLKTNEAKAETEAEAKAAKKEKRTVINAYERNRRAKKKAEQQQQLQQQQGTMEEEDTRLVGQGHHQQLGFVSQDLTFEQQMMLLQASKAAPAVHLTVHGGTVFTGNNNTCTTTGISNDTDTVERVEAAAEETKAAAEKIKVSNKDLGKIVVLESTKIQKSIDRATDKTRSTISMTAKKTQEVFSTRKAPIPASSEQYVGDTASCASPVSGHNKAARKLSFGNAGDDDDDDAAAVTVSTPQASKPLDYNKAAATTPSTMKPSWMQISPLHFQKRMEHLDERFAHGTTAATREYGDYLNLQAELKDDPNILPVVARVPFDHFAQILCDSLTTTTTTTASDICKNKTFPLGKRILRIPIQGSYGDSVYVYFQENELDSTFEDDDMDMDAWDSFGPKAFGIGKNVNIELEVLDSEGTIKSAVLVIVGTDKSHFTPIASMLVADVLPKVQGLLECTFPSWDSGARMDMYIAWKAIKPLVEIATLKKICLSLLSLDLDQLGELSHAHCLVVYQNCDFKPGSTECLLGNPKSELKLRFSGSHPPLSHILYGVEEGHVKYLEFEPPSGSEFELADITDLESLKGICVAAQAQNHTVAFGNMEDDSISFKMGIFSWDNGRMGPKAVSVAVEKALVEAAAPKDSKPLAEEIPASTLGQNIIGALAAKTAVDGGAVLATGTAVKPKATGREQAKLDTMHAGDPPGLLPESDVASTSCLCDKALAANLGDSSGVSKHQPGGSTVTPIVPPPVDGESISTAEPFVPLPVEGEYLAGLDDADAAAAAGFEAGKVYKGRVRTVWDTDALAEDRDWSFVVADGLLTPVPRTGSNVPCTTCKNRLKEGKTVCYRVSNGQHPQAHWQVLSVSLDLVDEK